MKRFDPLEKRLAGEHLNLAELADSREDVSVSWDEKEGLPPRLYKIEFNDLPSIVAIDEDNRPVFGTRHQLEIRLTGLYPAEPPVCYMRTPVWHPNIQGGSGPFKGRVCGNNAQFGAFFTLPELIWRIEEMLRYRIYHARMYYPFPEDEVAARWVNEVGEPEKIVKAGVGILQFEATQTEEKPANPIRVVKRQEML